MLKMALKLFLEWSKCKLFKSLLALCYSCLISCFVIRYTSEETKLGPSNIIIGFIKWRSFNNFCFSIM